jgi:poly(beta-D-mannuronate) lyase
MRDLEFYSMYSKAEGNSSVVDPKAYKAYKAAYKPISDYEVGLTSMANRYVRSDPPRPDIAACDLDWLAAWADAGALLGEVNKNGEYTRKWLLASLSNTWIQVRDEPSLDPAKRKKVLQWIHDVAAAAMADFSRDDQLKSRRNNHLYWAAWGIGSAGLATDDRSMFEWAVDKARYGIGLIQPDGTLPLEVERGQKAYLYHMFSAMPLFMLANAAEKNGIDLYSENDNGLARLAALCLKNLDDQSYFDELTGKKQDMSRVATPSDLGWLEVYARRYRDPRATAALARFRPVKHSRMGGNITLLYSGIAVSRSKEATSSQ